MMNHQAYADGWKAGRVDRTMGGEPNGYSWNGALDPPGNYSFYHSLGYRAGWTGGAVMALANVYARELKKRLVGRTIRSL
jgi:hypothetical protein